jgi:hypothetical protein
VLTNINFSFLDASSFIEDPVAEEAGRDTAVVNMEGAGESLLLGEGLETGVGVVRPDVPLFPAIIASRLFK